MAYPIQLAVNDSHLVAGATEVSAQLGLELGKTGTLVSAEQGNRLSVKRTAEGIRITYRAANDFYRALSMLPTVLAGGDDREEECALETLCYMPDMSRNAVCNMTSAKQLIRFLALAGYNGLMLYTEDTFEIPNRPYFGYMRGRFTAEELKEIDAYAYMMGLELIPCLQTLAHLSAALRWPAFSDIIDNNYILLVGEEKTYDLINDILSVCETCFRSRRINIGMDEAHDLGLGNYLKKHGYRKASDLMLEHLNRVTKICHDHGFEPMIWSDMFFRMAFGGKYVVREGEIAQDIIDRVPEGLTLIYWDYCTHDPQLFAHMLNCHLKFHNPIAFAGGTGKWYGFAPHNRFSNMVSKVHMDGCLSYNIPTVIVTSWGDDGNEAAEFSPLANILYFAERTYGNTIVDAHMELRAQEVYGIGYKTLQLLDEPNNLTGVDIDCERVNPCKYLVYNDPLGGLLDLKMDSDHVAVDYARITKTLAAETGHPVFGYMYDTLAKLCDFLSMKADLSVRIHKAYKADDKQTLAAISDSIPTIVEKLDAFIAAFRVQWYREHKAFGFDVQEIRLGGLRQRLLSTRQTLDDYLAGKMESIDMLEEEILNYTANDKTYEYIQQRWGLMTSASRHYNW